MDVRAAAPEGGPHGWLFGRRHEGGGGYPPWSLDSGAASRGAEGGLGALMVYGCGVASIWIRSCELVVLVLETSWWHAGVA